MNHAMVVALGCLLLPAIVNDLHSSRISNWLTLPAALCGMSAYAWLYGLQGFLFSLSGLAVGLGLFLTLYLSGGIGAGDVKLMAAVGSIVGPHDALYSALLAVTLGGLYALGAMCYQWGMVVTVQKLWSVTRSVLLARVGMQEVTLPFQLRYGLVIALGTVLCQLGYHPFAG